MDNRRISRQNAIKCAEKSNSIDLMVWPPHKAPLYRLYTLLHSISLHHKASPYTPHHKSPRYASPQHQSPHYTSPQYGTSTRCLWILHDTSKGWQTTSNMMTRPFFNWQVIAAVNHTNHIPLYSLHTSKLLPTGSGRPSYLNKGSGKIWEQSHDSVEKKPWRHKDKVCDISIGHRAWPLDSCRRTSARRSSKLPLSKRSAAFFVTAMQRCLSAMQRCLVPRLCCDWLALWCLVGFNEWIESKPHATCRLMVQHSDTVAI